VDWQALKTELARELTLSDELPRGFAATTRDGQRVLVESARGAATDWLVLRVHVCAEDALDAKQVLERNGKLAFAALVLWQGAYWLRVAVPFDSSELRAPTTLIALCIDAAQSLAPRSTDAFACFTR
jgi:hypothetical protein